MNTCIVCRVALVARHFNKRRKEALQLRPIRPVVMALRGCHLGSQRNKDEIVLYSPTVLAHACLLSRPEESGIAIVESELSQAFVAYPGRDSETLEVL